jgi:hypothetical protein
LLYLRARFYDPFTGQFLQQDPVAYNDSVNLYAAFANNPATVRDPSGMAPKNYAARESEGASYARKSGVGPSPATIKGRKAVAALMRANREQQGARLALQSAQQRRRNKATPSDDTLIDQPAIGDLTTHIDTVVDSDVDTLTMPPHELDVTQEGPAVDERSTIEGAPVSWYRRVGQELIRGSHPERGRVKEGLVELRNAGRIKITSGDRSHFQPSEDTIYISQADYGITLHENLFTLFHEGGHRLSLKLSGSAEFAERYATPLGRFEEEMFNTVGHAKRFPNSYWGTVLSRIDNYKGATGVKGISKAIVEDYILRHGWSPATIFERYPGFRYDGAP